MNSIKILTATACLILCHGFAGATNSKPTGAKELFFDPTDNTSAVSVQEPEGACASSEFGSTGFDSQTGSPRTVECKRRPVTKTSGETDAGLSYWIELVDREGIGQQVTEIRTFRSGERIRLHFLSNCDGVIALYQLGSSGQASKLFPNVAKGLANDRMVAGVSRTLPGPEAWFKFDGQPGIETVVVVFAPSGSTARQKTTPDDFKSRSTTMLAMAMQPSGSKDLVIERETEKQSEVGTYAVNRKGEAIVLKIALRHE